MDQNFTSSYEMCSGGASAIQPGTWFRLPPPQADLKVWDRRCRKDFGNVQVLGGLGNCPAGRIDAFSRSGCANRSAKCGGRTGEARKMEQHPADQTRIRREEVSPGSAP